MTATGTQEPAPAYSRSDVPVRLAFAAALSVLAGLAFAPVFGGYGPGGAGGKFQLALLGGVAVPVGLTGVVFATTRLAPLTRAAVSFGGLAAYVALVLAPGRAVIHGLQRLLTSTLPVQAQGPELAAIVLATGLAALCSAELALQRRGSLMPALPPLICAVGALAVGASAGPPAGWLGSAFALVVGAHLALTHLQVGRSLRPRAAGATAPSRTPSRAPSGPRLVGAPRPGARTLPRMVRTATFSVAAVAVAATAWVLVPVMPGGSADGATFDARSLVEQPVWPRSTVSPLVEFPALVDGAEQSPELTVRANVTLDKLRAVTLTEFDGTYWSTSTTYRRADQRLPPPASAPAVPGREVEISVAVEQAGSLAWLPTPGRAARLSVSGMGVDETTGDIVVPADREVPGRYSVVGTVPEFDGARLATDVPETTTDQPGYEIPPTIRASAAQAAAKGETPYDRVRKVNNLFRLGGGSVVHQYDDSDDPPAGHGLYQIGRLLTDHRGTAEQYASALAVMLRSLGYQARVVFGYLPRYDTTIDAYRVTGRDAHAWTEVLFEKSGWVPFDPSPLDRRIGTAADAPTRQRRALPPDPGDGPVVLPPVPPGGGAGDKPAPPPVSTGGPADDRNESGATRTTLVAAVLVAAVGIGALGAVPTSKTVRTFRRRRVGDVRACVTEAWREVVGRLADVGVPIHAGHTGAEVAAVVREHLSARVSSPVAELARVHQSAAFAPSPPREREADHAWSIVAAVKRQLREELPPLRRARAQLSLASLRRPANGHLTLGVAVDLKTTTLGYRPPSRPLKI